MISGLLIFGFFTALLASSLAALAAGVAHYYLRRGPRTGLVFLALMGFAVLAVAGGEVAVVLVCTSVWLVLAIERHHSFDRALWGGFLLTFALSAAFWALVVHVFGEDALAPIQRNLDFFIDSLHRVPREMGLTAIDAAEQVRELQKAGQWWVAALPGFVLARNFLVVWCAAAAASLLRKGDPWTRRELLSWSVPWYLVWILLGSGFGVLAVMGGWRAPLAPELLRTVSAGGLALSGTWFLVQGFLVALVAMRRWRIPTWLGVVLLVLLWRVLVPLGVIEIWAGLRGRWLESPEKGEAPEPPAGK